MTIQLKRNDTKDTISYSMTYADGTPVNLTGATVRFLMGTGKSIVTDSAAVIKSASSGQVEYTLKESDTLVAGTFKSEFQVTFSDGKVKTFPTNGYIMVNIQPNIDLDQSTYIEDQIANRVSDLQVWKNEIQAQLDQFAVGDSTPEVAQARVEKDGTTNTTLKARLDKKESEFSQKLDEHTSLLAQKAEQEDVDFVKATKAEKEYVDTLAQSLANGSPKGTYATYGELADAFPTGDSNIYVVTEDGNWYYWNGSAWVSGGVYQSTSIGDREIDVENTTFIKRGRNLFNVNTITVGKAINTTTGEITDNPPTIISDFIPVKQHTYYSRKNLCAVIRYYNNGDFLSGEVNGTTPINTGVATHVRLVMPLSQVYGQQFQEGETIAVDDYGLKLANKIDEKKVIPRIIKDAYSNKKQNDLYTSFNILKNTVNFSSGNAYLTDSYEHVWRTEDKSIKVKTTGVSPAYLHGEFNGVQSIEGISEILLAVYIPNITAITAFEIRMHMTDGTNWSPSLGNDKLVQGWNILRLVATRSTYGIWNNFDYFRIYAYTNTATEFYVGKMCAVIQNKAKVMVVCDHGYSNFKNVAYPQLKALGIPTTWGINPGRLGGAGGILTEEEIDELALDPYSEINMHTWDPTQKRTADMTADELRTDTLKCMRWIQARGYQPNHWWRAVFVGNDAPNHEAIRDMVEAYSTPTGAASYDLYPFIDKWNVGRLSLHGRDNEWFDDIFSTLKKTRSLVVLYTHDIHETDPIDLPQAQLDYFISKLTTAVNEGWIEGVTYDKLKTRYSRVFDVDDLASYLDTL